jgi:hypothetical protein
VKRSTLLTVIVGIVVMIALGCWLYYGLRLWDEITEPTMLVNFLAEKLDDMIPEAKKSLEDEIVKSSPLWAEHLSDKMLASVPDTRKNLESSVLEQMEVNIQKAHLMSEDRFRMFLKKHRPMLERQYKDLAADKAHPEAVLKEIEVALDEDEDIKVNLREDALAVLNTLKNANKAWKNMLAGKDLTEEQKLERRVWELARRLQLEQLEPEKLQQEKLPKMK